MRFSRCASSLAVACLVAANLSAAEPTYVKKATRVESIVASLKASGLPSLDGKWYYIGPFDNADGAGFDHAYPPEKEIDLAKTYDGKGEKAAWKEFAAFPLGKGVDLKRFKSSDYCLVYLYHEIDAPEAFEMPLMVGSDDSIVVFLNGERLVAENSPRSVAPDQNEATLKLKKGKNQLLIKVGNFEGDWAVYVAPGLPATWPSKLHKQLAHDFPTAAAPKTDTSAESKYYKIVTLPVPKDCVMEVGGLAMRPDGKLLACTRRGEVWLISNPGADNPDDVKFKLFATGLHEALGLSVDGKDVYVVQRPELTKLVAKDDVAVDYVTVCDKWGVSGDYHEFAFGPARDKKGNFYVTLNVGFGGGDQSKAAWRGWCVQITPKGDLVPYATGLRSPNGINFSPDGDLFYTDNQGEWVATNKLHHVQKGENYGHPAGLRWVKQSPFADVLKDKYPSGMLYDGQKGKGGASGMPQHTPPCVWFPYGRMGQSISEPVWDTTAGKFGPFAGQMLVGDQNKSVVMRVYLEKVNGRFQGACFPFRAGFESGVNRLAFGPDGSLYVGMTNRGWGSSGGKPYGLQRLVYTGVTPMEIHAMKLTKDGFDLTFTKPLDAKTAEKLDAYNLSSFTHNYWGTYGSPEEDTRAEKIKAVKVSEDRKSVSLSVEGLRVGRIYEVNLGGVKSEDGDSVLHPVGYYTLNDLVK
jgi:glucose/arabinose dehydrogenase